LNVVIINSTPKIVNVSCDDNVVNLSYNIIVSFCAYVFMFECFSKSILMFEDWNVFHWDVIYEMFLDSNQGKHHIYLMIRIQLKNK
jgi:hypothetical protein